MLFDAFLLLKSAETRHLAGKTDRPRPSWQCLTSPPKDVQWGNGAFHPFGQNTNTQRHRTSGGTQPPHRHNFVIQVTGISGMESGSRWWKRSAPAKPTASMRALSSSSAGGAVPWNNTILGSFSFHGRTNLRMHFNELTADVTTEICDLSPTRGWPPLLSQWISG